MSGALFMVSLRQAASLKRMAVIVVFALVPLGTAIAISALADGEDLVNSVLDPLVIATFLPITVMTIATTAFGNEVEDRTLGLLTMKPVSRLSIVLAKLGATLLVTAPLAVLVAIVVTVLGSDDESVGPAAVAAGVAAAMGAAAYGSIFTWAGLMNTRALGFGLVYVLLWEALLVTFVEGLRYLSVRSYIIGVMHGMEESAFSELADRSIELPAALAGAILATAVFAYLTVRRLQTMDVP